MEGKRLIEAVFNGETTDRAPWVPFAGVHAGKLIGASAKTMLSDVDTCVKAVLEANRLYRPDGQPVLFDLQIEAEVLGCDLVWADDAPPSVASHPLSGSEEIPTKIPEPTEGRIPFAVEAMKRVKAEVGDKTALFGLITGPFTLAGHLRGTDLFMDLVIEEEYAEKILDYAEKVAEAMATYYVEAGMDIIAVVDPLISQISPAHFEQFMHKPFAALFAKIKALGARSSFFVCGNATANIEPMCKTLPESISVDENVNLAAAKAITDRYGIAIGGNLPLTTVMLLGTQQDNMKAVVDLMDTLTPGRWIAAPGCDMPYDTPVENCIAAGQAVRESEQAREMVKNYAAPDLEFTGTIPDYASLKKPLVEVFTLDSATCAACTYMLASAKEAVARFGGDVDIVEYKFTIKENIARCVKMGVKQLPSLYLNGELQYSSIIPPVEELVKKIEAKL